MSVSRYGSYRDSGVEWLGEVPSHWGVSRLGFETWVRARLGWKGLKAEEYVDEGYAMLSTPDIKGREINFHGANRITLERYEESPEIKVKVGDVLLAKDGSTLGTCNIVRDLPRPATVNSSVAVISPGENIFPVYLFYSFQARHIQARIQEQKGGMGVPHLFQDDLVRFPVLLPPNEEQVHIAAFLDRETAKIDGLVEEQRRLIGLLKEKRQSVISHAVTKGIDPTVPMKDSGVGWLGEIPAHWDVRPLKRDLDYLTSGSRGWAEHYADDGALFIRIGNLTRDGFGLDLADVQRVAVPAGAEGERTRVEPGDLLFSITAFLGSVAVVPDLGERAYVSQHVALARLAPGRFRPEWVALVTLSSLGKTYFAEQGYGGTKVQLSLDDVAGILVTVPPLSEQATLIEAISNELTRIGSLVAAAESAITLLQERRAALISAAVTGKIDVRGLAPAAAEAEAA